MIERRKILPFLAVAATASGSLAAVVMQSKKSSPLPRKFTAGNPIGGEDWNALVDYLAELQQRK